MSRNRFIVSAIFISIVAALAYFTYIDSAQYKVGRMLEEVKTLRTEGRPGDAARICRKIVRQFPDYSEEATGRLRSIGRQERLVRQSAGQLAVTLEVLVDLELRGHELTEVDLLELARQSADQTAADNPAAAEALLYAVEEITPGEIYPEILQTRTALLERVLQHSPGDFAASVRLAVLYEAAGEADKCRALLSPLESRLDTTEGARILGRLTYADEPDRAYRLLKPYVDHWLPQYRDADRAYTKLRDDVWTQSMSELEAGRASTQFYETYEAGDEATQAELVQSYYVNNLRGNAAYRNAYVDQYKSSKVVPAAFDLGMLLVQRAHAADDDAERSKHLLDAEATFLAIQSAAGESDEFNLMLGQVNFWLGKYDEGKQLFDNFLDLRERDFQSLIQIAQKLRQVGLTGEAAALLEEAYENSATTEERHFAAAFRSKFSKGIEDLRHWLERSDGKDPRIVAELRTLDGREADIAGNPETAANHYRDAIAAYGKLEQSAVVLNDTAIVYQALHEATGERRHLQKYAELMVQAARQNPNDSIQLGNTAQALTASGLSGLIGEYVDLARIKASPSFSVLRYLYYGEAEFTSLLEKLRRNPDLLKAETHYNAVAVLSPKNSDSYSPLQNWYLATRNESALAGLLDKAERAQVDHGAAVAVQRRIASGEFKQQALDSSAGQLRRYRKVLKTLDPSKEPVLYALAAGEVVQAAATLYEYGGAADLGEMLRLAESAHRHAPSSGTSTLLQTALMYNIYDALKQKDKTFLAASDTLSAVLPARYTLLWAAGNTPAVSRAIAASPEAGRLIDLLKEDFARMEDSMSCSEWALAGHIDPPFADKVAAVIRENPADRLDAALDRTLFPANLSNVLNVHWYLQLTGDAAGADDMVRRYAELDIVDPYVVKAM